MKAVLSVLIAGVISITAGAQIPKLNSDLTAPAVVFLDFDGQFVQGTSWNWSGPINAQNSGLSSAAITEIFNRVAEDYRIFNLNITTDSAVYASAPATNRSRVIVTPTYQWYGAAGGVAYVGSFTWGDDTPAWVFNGLLNNNIKYVAEAISHEAGHTLGLQHQSMFDMNCAKIAEYCPGQGTGEISWAPIMGVGYYRNITTWHNGTSAYGCTYLQNDIEVIAGSPNDIGLRSDDHGNTHLSASPVVLNANNFQASGLINTSDDKDVFEINISSSTNFKLNAIPQSVGINNAGANIDIRVCLLNTIGDTLSRYNPIDLLDAGIDTTITSGIYYLVVEGVGNINLLDYGSLGFYSLNGTLATALPANQFHLSGNNNNGVHRLQWEYKIEETVKRIEVESSSDGIHFELIGSLPNNYQSFEWKPFSASKIFYRIKLVLAADEKYFYSNVITLSAVSGSSVVLLNSIVRSEIVLNATNEYSYQLIDQKGHTLKEGTLVKGINKISSGTFSNGLVLLRVFNKSANILFKLIKQ